MKSAKDGGAESFEEAFPGLRRISYRLALSVVRNVQDAEDVSSEALARALLHWNKIESLPYRDAWLLRVTWNLSIDVVRKRKRRVLQPENGFGVMDEVDDRLVLVKSLELLPRRQQEALVMRYIAGLPEIDAAQVLGISVNTLKTHIQRALEVLRPLKGPLMAEIAVPTISKSLEASAK